MSQRRASQCGARTNDGRDCQVPLTNGRCPHHGTRRQMATSAHSRAPYDAQQAATQPDPFAQHDERNSEWSYRAPTVAEQVADMEANWDGERCPHGTPVGSSGPDLICGACEGEMADEAAFQDDLDHHDRTGRWPEPVGPYLSYEQEQQRKRSIGEGPEPLGDVPF